MVVDTLFYQFEVKLATQSATSKLKITYLIQVRNFRVKLQEHIRARTEAQLVSVLIEGGCGSLEEAQMRIRRGIPIVILGDTGRISNVLSHAVDLARDADEAADG